MLEVAVLHRRKETTLERDPLDGDPYEAFDTTTIAGRFLIGWTWDLHEHFFISLAVGLSRGRETGRETIGHMTYGQSEPTLVERDISRMTTAAEAIVRVGTMIGW